LPAPRINKGLVEDVHIMRLIFISIPVSNDTVTVKQEHNGQT